jgi:hypothetical protein
MGIKIRKRESIMMLKHLTRNVAGSCLENRDWNFQKMRLKLFWNKLKLIIL